MSVRKEEKVNPCKDNSFRRLETTVSRYQRGDITVEAYTALEDQDLGLRGYALGLQHATVKGRHIKPLFKFDAELGQVVSVLMINREPYEDLFPVHQHMEYFTDLTYAALIEYQKGDAVHYNAIVAALASLVIARGDMFQFYQKA